MTPRAKVPVGLGPLRGVRPPRSTWARSCPTSYLALGDTGRTFPADLALPSRRAIGTRSDANATGALAEGLLQIVRVPVEARKSTAGTPPRGSTIFRLPRTQQQMPVFRVLTRKTRWHTCNEE